MVKITYLEKHLKRVITKAGRINLELLRTLVTKLNGEIRESNDGMKIDWGSDIELDTNKKSFSNDMTLEQLIYNSYGIYGLKTVKHVLSIITSNLGVINTLKIDKITNQELISIMTVLPIVERINDYCSSIKNSGIEHKDSPITDLRSINLNLEEIETGHYKVIITENVKTFLSEDSFKKILNLHYLVPEGLSSNGQPSILFIELNLAIDKHNAPYELYHTYTSDTDQGPYKVDEDTNKNAFVIRLMKFISFWSKGGPFDNSQY